MTILFVLTGLLMIVLAVPMIRGKISPNHWYGFRVRRTLEDPEIWYPANAYAGKLLLIYGLVIMATALILPRLFSDLTDEDLAWVMTFVLLGGIVIMLFLSWRYLRSL